LTPIYARDFIDAAFAPPGLAETHPDDTLVMTFGMLPSAFELGTGAEFRAPMARAALLVG
jgi:hypothetical protein